MISLGYHGKGPKTPLTSIALSSMIRKRCKIFFSVIAIIFYLTGSRTNWFAFSPPQLKVELLEGGTFWLSESPSVPGSISWGSEVPCIATWAISLWFRNEIAASIVFELSFTFVAQSLDHLVP